ncbi:hypothetical protein [Solidesulfovibrio sp.]
MTLDLDKFTWIDGETNVSAEELNKRFYALVRRLHALESLSIDWASAIAQVQNHGLERINEAVVPLIDSLKNDLAVLIAQGQEALGDQAEAVAAKLAEVDATMESVAAAIADITARIATVEASQQQFLTVTAPGIVKKAKKMAIIFG